MALSDFQFSYNGLTIGDQTSYDVVGVRGLVGPGMARVSDVLRPLDHGAFVNGGDFAPIRHVELDIQVEGSTDAVFSANVDALMQAFAPQQTELPFVFQLPGQGPTSGNRKVNCRPRESVVPVDVAYKFRMPIFTVILEATDPRVYAAAASSLTLTPGVVSGGLSWPLHWPLSWGSAASSNTGQAVNAGSFETRPIITLNGPMTTPKIVNLTTGAFTLLNYTIASGQTVTIDYLARTIVATNGSSLYYVLDPTSTWWTLPPGTTTLQLSIVSGTGTAVVSWSSAWI